MIDGASDEAASIATSGDWTVDLAPVDAAMPWEMLSALRGSGPTVLLIPGGLTRPVRVDASFAHDDDQLLVAGSCTLGECPSVDGSGIIPPGTEAIVVDAVGEWQLVPVWLTEPVTVEGI